MRFDAPPVTDPYMEATTDHVFGGLWARPGLAPARPAPDVAHVHRDPRPASEPLVVHLSAALSSGDLTADELARVGAAPRVLRRLAVRHDCVRRAARGPRAPDLEPVAASAQRGARGIPRPAIPMISRCTSLTPPPNVPTGAWRYACSSVAADADAGGAVLQIRRTAPTTSMSTSRHSPLLTRCRAPSSPTRRAGLQRALRRAPAATRQFSELQCLGDRVHPRRASMRTHSWSIDARAVGERASPAPTSSDLAVADGRACRPARARRARG